MARAGRTASNGPMRSDAAQATIQREQVGETTPARIPFRGNRNSLLLLDLRADGWPTFGFRSREAIDYSMT